MTAEDGRGAPDVPAKPAIWQRSVALSPPNFRVHGVVRLNSGQAPPRLPQHRGHGRKRAAPVVRLSQDRRSCSRHHVARSNRVCRAAGRSG
jgi:hypothetical protein